MTSSIVSAPISTCLSYSYEPRVERPLLYLRASAAPIALLPAASTPLSSTSASTTDFDSGTTSDECSCTAGEHEELQPEHLQTEPEPELTEQERLMERRRVKSQRRLRPKVKQFFYIRLLGPEGLERFFKDVLQMESFEIIELDNNETLLFHINDRQCSRESLSVMADIYRRGYIPLSRLYDLLSAFYLNGKIDRGDYLIDISWE